MQQLVATIHLPRLQLDSRSTSPSRSKTDVVAYHFDVLPRFALRSGQIWTESITFLQYFASSLKVWLGGVVVHQVGTSQDDLVTWTWSRNDIGWLFNYAWKVQCWVRSLALHEGLKSLPTAALGFDSEFI